MQNSGRVSAGAVQKNHTGSSTEPHQRAALTFKTNAHICGNQYNAFSFLMAFALYLQFKQKHVSFAYPGQFYPQFQSYNLSDSHRFLLLMDTHRNTRVYLSHHPPGERQRFGPGQPYNETSLTNSHKGKLEFHLDLKMHSILQPI